MRVGFLLLLVVACCAQSFIDVTVALRQRNLDQLEATLLQVSDVHSAMYGKYLTLEQVNDMVAPSEDDVASTERWLRSIGGIDIKLLGARDFMHASLPAEVAQAVIEARWSGTTAVLPLPDTVHFVFHSHAADVAITREGRAEIGADSVEDVVARRRKFTPLTEATVAAGGMGTPKNQKTAYGIPLTLFANNSKNSQMVWGTGTYGYLASDLAKYYDTFGIPSSENSAVSHQGYVGTPGGDNFGEGTLDISLISAMAVGVPSVASNTDNSSNTEWSYGFGPALVNFITALAANPSPPLVLSMSLGSLSWDSCNVLCENVPVNSNGQYTYQDCLNYMKTQRQVCMYPSSDEMDRCNTEFQKLGVRGSTLLAATGDGGSHFSFQQFGKGTPVGKLLANISCVYNFPTFPAASPYVVGVGGTQWSPSGPDKPVAWSASGGGFSWRFPMPSYQTSVVQAYLKANANKLPPAAAFNATNRAYPDVAALADNVPIVMDGMIQVTGGTSCSAPEWAGIISLLNDQRLNAGLPSLGFVNPRLYEVASQYPGEAFYDMTVGNSNCGGDGTCCATGFPAAVGWDPTTGLGSPIWAGLIKYLGTDSVFQRS